MLRVLTSRLPGRGEIGSVYAVILFFLFGWVTIIFFWKFPAWLYYANLGEVAIFYLYTAATEALEGLVYLAAILLLSAVLPASWFKDKFTVRGTIAALALPAWLLLVQYFIAYHEFGRGPAVLAATLISGGLAALWMWLSMKYIALERMARLLAERTPVFLYVYIPIAIISLTILLVRNLG
ncbi:MAG: hypothetical protein HY869_02370 [Chloroflexi bacterium]|nr:hypothetical protein [Chloroflexota bacterium]